MSQSRELFFKFRLSPLHLARLPAKVTEFKEFFRFRDSVFPNIRSSVNLLAEDAKLDLFIAFLSCQTPQIDLSEE